MCIFVHVFTKDTCVENTQTQGRSSKQGKKLAPAPDLLLTYCVSGSVEAFVCEYVHVSVGQAQVH